MVRKDTLLIIFYTLLFYSISLTLGFFSSYVLSKKNYNFRFPLFITAIQNLIHLILSNCVIMVDRLYRKGFGEESKNAIGKKNKGDERLSESESAMSRSAENESDKLSSSEESIKMEIHKTGGIEFVTKGPKSATKDICEIQQKTADSKPSGFAIPQYFLTIMPCAIAAALDIGMSSHALRSVTLAFYTMIKSSSPVFVLLSGFLFGIERPSFKLFITIFIIGSGVFVTTIKTDKDTKSMELSLSKPTIFLLFASFMAGFRWSFVQYLLEKRTLRKRNIVFTIRELCLPIGILLFLFSLYFEGLTNIIESEFFQNENAIRKNITFIVLSGVLSFVLLVSEFLLVSKTSVVYLSVSGIVKELMIVFVSVCRKEINFDTINYCGLGISIAGMVLYNLTRLNNKQNIH